VLGEFCTNQREDKGKRIYHNAPVKLSKVDEVVFGRDTDNSQHRPLDAGLLPLLDGAAGQRNVEDRGRRVYNNACDPTGRQWQGAAGLFHKFP